MKGVRDALNRWGEIRWIAEASFAHPLGFGGKVDLHHSGREQIVLDVKTKDKIVKNMVYDEHLIQLACYRRGLQMPHAVCANVFVSVSNPGEVVIIEHGEEELVRGWAMFTALLDLWKAKNRYDPSFDDREAA